MVYFNYEGPDAGIMIDGDRASAEALSKWSDIDSTLSPHRTQGHGFFFDGGVDVATPPDFVALRQSRIWAFLQRGSFASRSLSASSPAVTLGWCGEAATDIISDINGKCWDGCWPAGQGQTPSLAAPFRMTSMRQKPRTKGTNSRNTVDADQQRASRDTKIENPAAVGCSTDDVVALIPSLRGYARGLTRNVDDADDLVQETMVKAIANAGKFQAGTNLRAWLFTIMRNTFLTGIRKTTRESPGAGCCASLHPVTHPQNETRVEGQRLMASIEKLPAHYREVVMLVLVIGESYKDVAIRCNCAVGTVKSRVNRARRMIIEDLGTEDLRDVLVPVI